MITDFRFSPDDDESRGFASVRLEPDKDFNLAVRLTISAPPETEGGTTRRMELDIPLLDWLSMCRSVAAAFGRDER